MDKESKNILHRDDNKPFPVNTSTWTSGGKKEKMIFILAPSQKLKSNP